MSQVTCCGFHTGDDSDLKKLDKIIIRAIPFEILSGGRN